VINLKEFIFSICVILAPVKPKARVNENFR
jgi:hypothetical protein